MTETTRAHQRPAHLWRPGQSGNLAGRPKGSRNKLAESFVQDVYDAWQQQGAAAVERAIASDPMGFCKMVAGLLPKDVHIKHSSLDDMTDEQLLRKLAVLTEMARPLLARATAIDAVVEPERNPNDTVDTPTP
jgi:hypothetical protein